MNPSDAIMAGREILEPLLAPAGFRFELLLAGDSSNGPYAEAAYVRDDRRLAFSYRLALGDVEYRVGDATLDHNAYMRLLGVYPRSVFASFSREEPLAGFEALRTDLAAFGEDFLVGPGTEFVRLASAAGFRVPSRPAVSGQA